MCCLNVIAEVALVTGWFHVLGAMATERVPPRQRERDVGQGPGSLTASVASPAVLTTVAVVLALYAFATPGLNAPKAAGRRRA